MFLFDLKIKQITRTNSKPDNKAINFYLQYSTKNNRKKNLTAKMCDFHEKKNVFYLRLQVVIV
jgi:hypothetical protein